MAADEPELLVAVARLVAVFDELGVDYLVGGSVASMRKSDEGQSSV